jgi:hypothetical protein
MTRDKEIPELLAEYMKACKDTERWITVYELRSYFHLDESYAHAISGFLRRIHYRPYFSYLYRVKKIERIIVFTPQRRCINRYLVKKRPEIYEVHSRPSTVATAPEDLQTICLPGKVDHEHCTDHDALEIFNNVLHKQTGQRVT